MNIRIIRDTETLRYAAEEFKKYLSIVTPSVSAEITVGAFDESALNLGLLGDYGLSDEGVLDPMIDDLLDLDVKDLRGYVAGSNERSVLMGVYNYLKSAGCRFVRPGELGEYLPKSDLTHHSFKYRKLADFRFRGECIEGAVSFEHVRDTILWLPKANMNLFMIEQIVPYNYMNRWYRHTVSTVQHDPEPPYEQYCKWCEELEHIVKKCGLQLHNMGHGALNEPFGVRHMISGQHYDVPEETKKAFALVKGKRELFGSSPFFTQLCMSKDWIQERVVNWLADYISQKPWVDFLHFWLADATNNHCECEDCVKHTPSDLYVQMLNKLDKILTERGINTKIVFIMYTDTLWPPIAEKLNNPSRFIMTTAIFRAIGDKYSNKRREGGYPKWKRNDFDLVGGFDVALSFMDGWKSVFDGPKFIYEYYMYTAHFSDPGYMAFSKMICDDIKTLDITGFDGIMSDQTQRSFFPTGLPMNIIGEMQFDKSLDFDEFVDKYLCDSFGEDYRLARDYLYKLSVLFDMNALTQSTNIVAQDTGAEDKNAKKAGIIGNAELGKRIATVPSVVDALLPTIEKNLKLSDKCHAESWRILTYHAEYCKRLSEIYVALSLSDIDTARKHHSDLIDYLSRVECEIHPYFDLVLFNQRTTQLISGK